MLEKKKRDINLDAIKGFLIILVVLGHCIQYGSGSEYLTTNMFFENNIYKVIYSFHMPLFALISGYLFYYGIDKKNFLLVFKNKIKTLLMPAFWYGIFVSLGLIAISIVKNKFMSGTFIITMLINKVYYGLWFLWAMFILSIITYIIYKYFRSKIIYYIILFIIILLLPDSYNLFLYKFMYPYFILGFLFNYYFGTFNFLKNDIKFMIILVIYVSAMLFYNKNCYIYTTKMSFFNNNVFNIQQIIINTYRYFVGFLGLIITVSFINSLLIKLKKILAFLGKYTLEIYFFSNLLTGYVLDKLTKNAEYNIIFSILETIIVIIMSLIFTFLFKKNNLLNKIVFGNR